MNHDLLSGAVNQHQRVQLAIAPIAEAASGLRDLGRIRFNGYAAVEHDKGVERPRVARFAAVMGRFGRRLEIDDRSRIVLADARVDHGDGAARRRIMRRERSDHQRVLARHGLGLEHSLREDHVVRIERRLIAAVRQDGPEALDHQRIAVDIFPASKEDAAVGQHAPDQTPSHCSPRWCGCHCRPRSSHAGSPRRCWRTGRARCSASR